MLERFQSEYCDCTPLPNLSNFSVNVNVFSRNRNRKLQISKAPLKSQEQGTSLFTRAASNQRGFPIVRGRFRSGCQRVRECVKSEGFSKEMSVGSSGPVARS